MQNTSENTNTNTKYSLCTAHLESATGTHFKMLAVRFAKRCHKIQIQNKNTNTPYTIHNTVCAPLTK